MGPKNENNLLVSFLKQGRNLKPVPIILFFQVCELHFHAHEIKRAGSVLNSTIGETVTYDLEIPRLSPGSLSSKMPNCPEYLSAPAPTVRKSRQIKLQENEQKE